MSTRARPAFGHSSGFTLVEMLVALLVLGVVLAAAAASLTGFSRQAIVNERRVQATSFLSQLHESLQALDWDLAVNLDTDLDDLSADDLARLQELGIPLDVSDPDAPTLDGEELVVLEECPPDDLCVASETRELMPIVFDDQPAAVDGRTFDESLTFVTWADGGGDDGPRAKRFVTYLTWTVLSTSYVQRFESLRAPTATDIAEAIQPDVITFQLSPSTVRLDIEGRPVTTPEVVVEFNRGMDTARVGFPCWQIAIDIDTDTGDEVQRRDGNGRLVGQGPPEICEVDLAGQLPLVDSRWTFFEGELDLPADRIWIVDGEPDIADTAELQGSVLGQPSVTRTANLSFIADDGEVAPEVVAVLVNPPTIVRRANGNLCPPGVTVTATIHDLDEDGTVSVSYPITTGTGRVMTATDASRTTWELTFAEGSASPWTASDNIRFTVTAANGDAVSAPQESNVLTVTAAPNCN